MMKRFLLAFLLCSGAASAQTVVGPLMVKNNLSEIAFAGSIAQAAARTNLGFSGTPPFCPIAGCTFTGLVTFSGSPTGISVTNAATLAGGGTFSGTFAGTPIWSGAATFQSTVAVSGAATLAGGTASGTFTFNGSLATGTPTALSGAQTASQRKVNIVTQYSGSTTTPAACVVCFTNNADTVAGTNAPGGLVGFFESYNWGTSTATGPRTGMRIDLVQTAKSGNFAAGFNPVNVALLLNQPVNFSEGGTALPLASWGQYTTFGIQTKASNGATFLTGIAGLEIDNGIQTGASARSKKGLLLVKWSDDAVQSIVDDDAVYIADQGGATVGWRRGIAFGSEGDGQWSIDGTNGALMQGLVSALYTTVPSGARYGFDALQVGFPAFNTTARAGFLSSNGFAVDGIGAVEMGTTYFTPSSTGLSIDAKGIVGTGTPTISAGGSNYVVGDIIFDAWGGVYKVATLSGSAVATVTLYADGNGVTRQPLYPSATPPANPVATVAWGKSAGSGATLTLSWNSTANGIVIAGSSTKVGFYGATAIVKATPVGACAGNTGCQALRNALGNLGLINTGSITD